MCIPDSRLPVLGVEEEALVPQWKTPQNLQIRPRWTLDPTFHCRLPTLKQVLTFSKAIQIVSVIKQSNLYVIY